MYVYVVQKIVLYINALEYIRYFFIDVSAEFAQFVMVQPMDLLTNIVFL